MKPVTLSLALSEVHAPEASLPQSERGKRAMEHTILREGEWKHPKAPGGKLTIDGTLLTELAKNFSAGVGLADGRVPFHVGHTEHQDDRAAAWANVSVVPDPDRPGKQKMVALAQYTTPEDYAKVQSGQYAFVSPSIDFGYADRESGQNYRAVLRNVALTNYPFIKRMGPARCVNLSEIAEGEGDAATVKLAFGYDGSDPSGSPNPDGLPSGYDLTALPNQCRTCARLGNDCPFAADKAADDLTYKAAAAGSGNCPQYIEADGQTPGAGGAADAASQSPVASRNASAPPAGKSRVPMSDNRSTTNLSKRTHTMNYAQIKRLQNQVKLAQQEKQDKFLVALSETHHLPADALTAVKTAFETGTGVSLALSEALDGQTVELSEKAEDFKLPDAIAREVAKVDLSDSVTLPREALRELLESVASATRTQLSEEETKLVDGKPDDKRTSKDVLTGGVKLSEFEGLSPAATVAKVREMETAGKLPS